MLKSVYGKYPDLLFHIVLSINPEKLIINMIYNIRVITDSLQGFKMEKYEIFYRF